MRFRRRSPASSGLSSSRRRKSLEENPLIAAALDLLNIRRGLSHRRSPGHCRSGLRNGDDSARRQDRRTGQSVCAGREAQVYGVVDIDMIAGPSEVAIIADETCDPAWIAADLLAQAEHDEMAGVWLICWSREVAAAVFDEVQVQLRNARSQRDRARRDRKQQRSRSSSQTKKPPSILPILSRPNMSRC